MLLPVLRVCAGQEWVARGTGGGCKRGGGSQAVILAVGSFQKDVKVCVWCSGWPYPKYPAVQGVRVGEGRREDEDGETAGVAFGSLCGCATALPAAGEAPSPVGRSFPLC